MSIDVAEIGEPSNAKRSSSQDRRIQARTCECIRRTLTVSLKNGE